MRLLAKALTLLTILPMATLSPRAVAQQQGVDAIAHWARVLTTFVNDRGEVDFQGLPRNPTDLKAFVDYVAEVSPDLAPELFPTRESRLDYHINAYNALAMYNVIDSGMPKSLSGLIAYVNRYAPEKIPEDYQVEFIDYDWTVNDQNRDRN